MKGQLSNFIQKNSLLFLGGHLLLIIVGSLSPRLPEDTQTGEISMGLSPKEGDNFKIANDPIVYRLENGKRRQYKSANSFFNHSNNKPFDTPYREGGILICDKETVIKFPKGDYMPYKEGGIGEHCIQPTALERLASKIWRWDKLGHFLAYAILAILLLLFSVQYTVLGEGASWGFVLLIGTVLGVGIEYLQFTYITGRNKEVLDLLFNSLGLLGGVFFYKKWWIK
ncbi:VanZ family protein [Aureispira anguillae]|uniref:VanZ family protein n=1 Tax=Aureispira anguillae TaxID=2864201 RepID=A0A915YAR9_9BACT|nr:VanZ family protein [Aureispira anguillae]BDS09496.1 VanZ family protein [Aureispira anguillae]